MKDFIKSVLPSIRELSLSLDKKAIFLNHPWILINENGSNEKLIFRKNGELIMSKEGNVITGTWEYLSYANSLLIDRGQDKRLYNQGFIDECIMVLKLDGTMEDYHILVNQNKIPDLNYKNYLRLKTIKEKNLKQFSLVNGGMLFCEECTSNISFFGFDIGLRIFNDDLVPIDDGDYRIEHNSITLSVKKGIVKDVFKRVSNKHNDVDFTIEQINMHSVSIGDRVYISNNIQYNGEMEISNSQKIKVEDGIVKKIYNKNIFGKWK